MLFIIIPQVYEKIDAHEGKYNVPCYVFGTYDLDNNGNNEIVLIFYIQLLVSSYIRIGNYFNWLKTLRKIILNKLFYGVFLGLVIKLIEKK